MISLIMTVHNEEKVLPRWFESIEKQIRKPDEVVIVDGMSTDGTWDILEEYVKHAPFPVKTFQRDCNIASGRNSAIRHARGDIIVVTDAGCVYEPEWLEEITERLRHGEAHFVSTAFAPWFEASDRPLLYAIAAATTPALHEFKKPWLPSSRSVAFLKSVWHSVGGYPEWIPLCEDVIFDLTLKKNGIKFVLLDAPMVKWRPRPTVWAFMRQVANYTRSEAHGKLNLHRQLIRFAVYGGSLALVVLSIIYTPFFLIILALGFIFYMKKFWQRCLEFAKELPTGKKVTALVLTPLIIVLGDIAKMAGWVRGLSERTSGKIKDPSYQIK